MKRNTIKALIFYFCLWMLSLLYKDLIFIIIGVAYLLFIDTENEDNN